MCKGVVIAFRCILFVLLYPKRVSPIVVNLFAVVKGHWVSLQVLVKRQFITMPKVFSDQELSRRKDNVKSGKRKRLSVQCKHHIVYKLNELRIDGIFYG